MPIYHLSMKPMSRSSGRSAVAAAAYRAGEKLLNERDGLIHDFTRRGGVEHAEIVLPEGSNAEWAKDRSALWNAAESVEKRKDARVAREVEIALPHELTPDQRLALVREFSQHLADRYGVAVDFAIHAPHAPTDERNHHAHLMMTTRKVEISGLGEKSEIELDNRKLQARGLPTSHDQLRAIRQGWGELANQHLTRAGLELRIDHRSHAARGIEIEPTQHMGVHATQMERRGKEVTRVRLESEASKRNAERIREKPEQVLTLITNEKSVFDRHDVARALNRALDSAEEFQAAFARVMASPALVELRPEERDGQGRTIAQARYSTKEMVDVEREMAEAAERMAAEKRAFAVAERHLRELHELDAHPHLANEQQAAVRHITGPERIAAVVGLAGAGKSTMLAAAREVWEAGGYRVHGAALAGKAAEGLEEASGISSRTLASWERGWEKGFDRLGTKDIFVVDEAGMVGSKQLARFIAEADQTGAKIVLVGDPEQLQPIGAGAAFRAVAEKIGFVELETVRRQKDDWQRAASVDLGRHRTAEGLAAYEAHGGIRLEATRENARDAIVREVMADRQARPEGSRLVLAHRRIDVRELNDAIRAARKEQGELAGEIGYQTASGERHFAAGDRFLFGENHRHLGVKNGMLATVEQVREGRIEVQLDSARGPGQGRAVSVSLADYQAVDHGYATTIHKSQGTTVDRSFVLASGTMDRHLTYVALTRHREEVRLYAGKDEFRDTAAMTARLSRAQPKETTLDYDRAGYAGRRGIAVESGIVVREKDLKETAAAGIAAFRERFEHEARAKEKQTEPPARKRSTFDGLKLNPRGPQAGRGAEHERERAPASAADPERQPHDPLSTAVENYALAWSDAQRMLAQGLPVLEYQKRALREAGADLDAARPNAKSDLVTALKHEPSTWRAMTELQGSERTAKLVAAIAHEERVRRDPALKAERLVKVWNGLEAQYERLGEKLSGHDLTEERGKIAAGMKSLYGEIKNDAQLAAQVRGRSRQLGIEPGSRLHRLIHEPKLERTLLREIERGLERGHERDGWSR